MKLHNSLYHYARISFLLLVLLTISLCQNLQAQSDINGTINTYYRGIGQVDPSTTDFSLGNKRNVAAPDLIAGDWILFIQMQGADINHSNDNSYGDGKDNTKDCIDADETPSGNYGEPSFAGGYKSSIAGVYEFSEVVSVSGTDFQLKNPLVNSYETSSDGKKRYQIIRVPVYNDLRLTGDLTAENWNGHTGGIVVVQATGNFDFNDFEIQATEIGFRGGVDCSDNQVTSHYDFFSTSDEVGGKGEGIAGTPEKIWYANAIYNDPSASSALEGNDFGRGAPANAGGGGNGENAGGGGGANGGYGGAGGGAWNGVVNNGGFGGAPFLEVTSNRMVLGGAGGAGEGNNVISNNGKALHGGTGGGIVIINSASVSGNGMINANGGSAEISQQDGAGGGGAGGSVIIRIETGDLSELTINANGGNGGENSGTASGQYKHGDGGGGGGGVVFTQLNRSNAELNATVYLEGGKGGKARIDANIPEYTDGTDGGNGVFNLAPPQVTEPQICGNMPVLTDFTVDIESASTYTFTASDFDDHVDENPDYTDIKIVTLPVNGELWFNGVKKTSTFTFSRENINLLEFKKGASWIEDSEAAFLWDVKYYKYTESTARVLVADHPEIQSIKRKDPLQEVTNETSVEFKVKFSRNVLQFDENDLQLTGGGSASISSVNVNPSDSEEYFVTVDGIDASGELNLSFKDLADVDVKDVSDEKVIYSNTFVKEYYTLDITPPTIPTVEAQVITEPSATIEGTFNFDDTQKLQITFNGQTYEYIKDGEKDANLNVTADGKWSLEVNTNGMSNGSYELTISAEDELGNISTDTSSNEIEIDLKSFDCQSGFYQIVQDDTNVTYLKVYNPETESYTNVNAGVVLEDSQRINAAGFNKSNGRIYGIMKTPGSSPLVNKLVSFDSDGNLKEHGIISDFHENCNTGDFQSARDLYVMSGSGDKMYRIDITNNEVVEIGLTTSFKRADIAYSSVNNLFYTVINERAVLATISLDGNVIELGEIKGLPKSGYGAQWITREGYYFVFDNDGKMPGGGNYPGTQTYIYKVDLARKEVVGRYLSTENSRNDGAGCPDMYAPFDTDRDTQLDFEDQDADGDGISNIVENGNIDPYSDGQNSGNFVDTDNDGIPNYLDLDSDNDGIPDNIEAQVTSTYQKPLEGVNENGFNNAYPTGLTPIDTDGDHTPDYLDEDSDGDGVLDKDESHKSYTGTGLAGEDDDKDGISNEYDNTYSVYGTPNQSINSVEQLLNKYMSNSTELYFRQDGNRPPIANPITISISEDSERWIKNDFKYSDPDGDEFSSVKIFSVSKGTLFLDTNGNGKYDAGEEQTATTGTPLQVDNSNLSKLGFIGSPNENGNNYSHIIYKVNDGNAYSFLEYDLQINIDPVDDSPVLNGIIDVNGMLTSINEDEKYTFEFSELLGKVTYDQIDDPIVRFVIKEISKGTLSNDNGIVESGVNLVFTPTENFAGTSDVTFVAVDASGNESNEITGKINVIRLGISEISSVNEVSVSENIELNETVGITAVAVDGDDDKVTYELLINPGNWFGINSESGVVFVAGDINYEDDGVVNAEHKLDIRVKASSADGTSSQKSFTIQVNNADGSTPGSGDKDNPVGPVKDSDATDNTVNENAGTGELTGLTGFATDPDGDDVSYRIDNSVPFSVEANTGIVRVAGDLDYDTQTSYDVIIIATSTDGSTSQETFSIAVTDADGSTPGSGDKDNPVGPVKDSDATDNTVNENAGTGELTGLTGFATDPDGDDVSYRIDNSVPFSIETNTGVVRVSGNLDYDIQTSYDVIIIATSTDGSTSKETFSIAVTDADGSTPGSGDKDNPVGPVKDSDATDNTVNENAGTGELTGLTGFATDPDGDDVSYRIDNSVPFSIETNTGVVRVSGNLDYDIQTSYDVIIIATSTDGSTSKETFTIAVTDADGSTPGSGDKDNPIGPVSDSNTADNTVNENAGTGELTGLTGFATDPDGDDVSYRIDNSVPFSVEANTGIVRVAGDLDYDTQTSYDVIIIATSTDGSTSKETFTIAVTDADGSTPGSGDKDNPIGPVSDSNTADNTVNENAGTGELTGLTGFATDPDGDDVSYRIDNSVPFSVEANTGVVRVAGDLDYDTQTSYDVIIIATSTDGSTSQETFSIAVTDADGSTPGSGDKDNPIGPVSDSNTADNTVNENAGTGELTGLTGFATDPDGDDVSYRIDNSVPFSIEANTGVVRVAGDLDYDTQTSYAVIIIVTSTDGSTSQETFTIAVTDADGSTPGSGDKDNPIGPVSDSNTADNTVNENAGTGELTGLTGFATDPDGDDVSYRIDNSVPFSIETNTGVVRVAGDLDYDTQTSYDVIIVATSTDGSTSQETFTIEVTDADGSTPGSGDKDNPIGPVSDSNTADNTVNENAGTGELTGLTGFATDPDGDDVSYRIDNSVPFSIEANTGVVRVAGDLDYDTQTSYDVIIIATSTDGSTSQETFSIAVTDADGSTPGSGDKDNPIGPVSDSNTADNTVNENAGTGELTGLTGFATDPDGDDVSYRIDNSVPFSIEANTGVVRVAGDLDYDTQTSYAVIIIVTSTDGSTSQETFTIAVTDADGSTPGSGDKDNPIGPVSDSNTADNTVNENAGTGELTGLTGFATDPDGDDVSYRIDNSVPFSIEANTGIVRVAGDLDYDTQTSYDVIVIATSTDGSTSKETFTIAVTDADGSIPGSGDKDNPIGPVSDSNTADNTVNENAGTGELTGLTGFATDPDGDDVSYRIDNSVPFSIEKNTGVVRVSGNLDYDIQTSYDVIIIATSTDGSTSQNTFTIAVTDADGSRAGAGDRDNPVGPVNDSNTSDNTVLENANAGTATGLTGLAADPDGDYVTYELQNDSNGKFSIDIQTGEVFTALPLDYENATSHTLTIKAISTDGSFSVGDFTVQVTNENEAPAAMPDVAKVLEGNTLQGENVMMNDSDVDGDAMHVNTTPVEDVKHGTLTIHNDGTYTYIPEEYFNGNDYFIYELIDEGAPHKNGNARVDITVIPVNNNPVANNDELSVNEDEQLSGINVLTNDSDIETDIIINTKPIEDAKYGKLKIYSNGTFTYEPNSDFNGEDEFVYEISDQGEPALKATARVVIHVLPQNDQPVAHSLEISVKENSLDNEIPLDAPEDVDGDELSVSITSIVEFGEVLLPNHLALQEGMKITVDELLHLRYNTEERNVSEVYFEYEVSDPDAEVDKGIVKIKIEPNDVFIPEAITPNDDGYNDKFVIVGLKNYPNNSLKIFNRWGNLVYRKDKYDNSWNGYGNVRGQLSNDRLPPGTYYYDLKIESERKTGYIYLTY